MFQKRKGMRPLTFIKMATIKKTENNKCWQGCGETGKCVHYWGECKVAQLLGKSVEAPPEMNPTIIK